MSFSSRSLKIRAFKGVFTLFFCVFSVLSYVPSSFSREVVREGYCLSPQSLFAPIQQDSQIKDIGLLEYLAINHLAQDPSLVSSGVEVKERISSQTTVSLDFRSPETLGGNRLLIPAAVNDNRYFIIIDVYDPEERSEVAVLTVPEVNKAREDGLIARHDMASKRDEDDEIKAYIRHELTTDARLAGLPSEARVVLGAADKRVRNVVDFLRASGAEALAEDFEAFAAKNRIFMILRKYLESNETIDHASNISIHVTERDDAGELEKVLVHEALARAGVPAAVNDAEDMMAALSEAYFGYRESLVDTGLEYNGRFLCDRLSVRSQGKINLRDLRFADLNSQRDRDYSSPDKNPDVASAISRISDWKKVNAAVLDDRSKSNLFWTNLQEEANRIYLYFQVQKLPFADRVAYCRAVFDEAHFPNVNHVINTVLNRMPEKAVSGISALTPEEHNVLADLISVTSSGYTIIDKKNIKFAFNSILLDLSPRERRIIELKWLVGEIDKELAEPGSGNLPLTVVMQDIHGGQRRASALVGFTLGLARDAIKRIFNVKDLKRALREKGIDIDAINGRFIGFNDKYDRGHDPVGAFELVQWLNSHRRAKPFAGNHDIIRALSVLGIHDMFDEMGVDYNAPDQKNHHPASWSKMGFEHAGWGNIEFDAENEARFNSEIDKVNVVLRLYDLPGLPHVDITKFRSGLEEEMKALKKENAVIRAENEANRDNKDWQRKPEKKLPNIREFTWNYVMELVTETNERIGQLNREHGLDIQPVTPATVGLHNYRDDPRIIERTLWELKNFRLFYVDVFGNLHIHSAVPFDFKKKKLKVAYKGLEGLPAVELMSEEIRMFFENMDTIPNSEAFRKKMWEELGDAFTTIMLWYSDIDAHAKPVAIKEFIDAGGPAAVGESLLGFPIEEFSARPISFALVLGHNEKKKFAAGSKTPLPWININVETNRATFLIDREMSEGYNNMGAVLTFFKRDENGRITGIRNWGYPEPGSEEIADLTFEDIDLLDPEQQEYLRMLSDGESFMKWFRARALEEIFDISRETINEAKRSGRKTKAKILETTKEWASAKLEEHRRSLGDDDNSKGSPLSAMLDIVNALTKSPDTVITKNTATSWRKKKRDNTAYAVSTVADELSQLASVGLLERSRDGQDSRDREEDKATRYDIAQLIKGLTADDIVELGQRLPVLDRSRIPTAERKEVRIGVLKFVMDKIHFKNMELSSGAAELAEQEKKTIYYLIPESMVPAAQHTMLRQVSQQLEKAKSKERILLVADDDIVSRALKIRDEDKAMPFVASRDGEMYRELFEVNGVKTLRFGGEVGDIRQVEGMIAALRAYATGNAVLLKDIYSILTGKRITASLYENVDTIAKGLIFELPPIEELDTEEIMEMNRHIKMLLLAA